MKKRILFVSSAPHVAGGETNLFSLINTLDGDKFVSFCLYHPDSRFHDYIDGKQVELTPFLFPLAAGISNRVVALRCFIFLLNYLKRNNINLIYVNTVGDFKYLRLLGKICKIPVILHIHVDEDDQSLRWIKAAQAQKLLFPSHSTLTTVLEHSPWIPRGKCSFIHNAVQTEIFYPRPNDELREALGLSSGVPIIGIVGQLKHIKGQHLFIEAVKQLKQSGIRAHFLIVGDDNVEKGQYLSQLKSQAKKSGLQNEIIFLGYRTDIPEIMSLCDLIAVPSLHEPFGRVVIEAMACGTPVVASSVGGIVEIFEDGAGGLFCEVGNAEDLALKIKYFLDHPDWWEEQKKKAVITVENSFTQDRHTEKVEECMVDVIERSGM